jgi:hypothetical protein
LGRAGSSLQQHTCRTSGTSAYSFVQ